MPLPAEVLIRLFGPIIDYGQQTSLSASSYVLQPKHLLTEQWEKMELLSIKPIHLPFHINTAHQD